MNQSSTPSITVESLQKKLQHLGNNLLLDVREPFEIEIASLPEATCIPLGELPVRLQELEKADEIYLLCRSGVRSAHALELLQKAGFSNLYNVEGGILAWAEHIDPSMQKY